VIKKTLKEISKDSKLSIKEIRRQIVAGALPAEYISKKYFLNEDDYQRWLEDIPDLSSWVKDKSHFFSANGDSIEPDSYIECDISDDWEIDFWKSREITDNFRYVDLFAGAGGLSLGFLMAGFKPVGFLEQNNSAVKTYEYNFHKKSVHSEGKDITKEDVKSDFINSIKDKNVDVIIGGFPCKGFSLSGSRVITDHRNTLYKEMVNIVREVNPKIVVMENVVGILSMQNGLVIDKIINDYHQIGYKISYKILNSADFEVPQLRRRVILIASKLDSNIYFPNSIIKNTEEYLTVKDGIERFLDLDEDSSINHIFSRHSESMKVRLSNVKEGKTLYSTYSDSWKKSPWDKPSCTIKENHGATNIHPKLPRVITPREMASLQSFPDDFIFIGSKAEQLKQIGNAVPPLLAKAIALAVKKMLKE
jgi:DNA (cytosine-5)-methyltransferase 1